MAQTESKHTAEVAERGGRRAGLGGGGGAAPSLQRPLEEDLGSFRLTAQTDSTGETGAGRQEEMKHPVNVENNKASQRRRGGESAAREELLAADAPTGQLSGDGSTRTRSPKPRGRECEREREQCFWEHLVQKLPM